ncbi:MAG: hypothetical protein IKZ60_05480, partial [Bacteroidales bacterium]|nr:hypothetical protein [Bacteroidales bacterium]
FRELQPTELFFVLGGLTLAFTYFQMISQFWLNNFVDPVVWNPEPRIHDWQVFIFVGRAVGITLLYLMSCIFIIRIIQGLGIGEIFPRSSIALIRWAAPLSFVLAFIRTNYNAAVQGESVLQVDSNSILIPLIVLLFAGLYKMAYLAAKDSKLAI